MTSVTTQFLSGTWAVLASIFNAALVPLFAFYFLRDFDKMKASMSGLVPLPHRERVAVRARRVDGVVGHWFRGQVTVAAILGISYTVGLGLCGVKLWYAIGILAGVMSIVPYLGFLVGIGLALLMSGLDDGSGWGQIVGVLCVFAVVQMTDAYFITPKIVGDKVGLSPVVVIIVLLMGGASFGFLGVLLAIPTTAVLRVFVLEAIADYKRSRAFLGEQNYLAMLAEGPSSMDAEVREALRQAAEAALDTKLPTVLTADELKAIGKGSSLGSAVDSETGDDSDKGRGDGVAPKGPEETPPLDTGDEP
jgi:predicted PurR-regulated permease PerM